MKSKVTIITAATLNVGDVVEVDVSLPPSGLFGFKKRYPSQFSILNDTEAVIGALALTEKEEEEKAKGLTEFELLRIPADYTMTDNELLAKTGKILIQKLSGTATADLRVEAFGYSKNVF